MMDLLAWIEGTAFATWVRESVSLWAYPGMLSFHTIGLGFVAGISSAIDLRILGVASSIPLAPMQRFLPVMWAGFWVNALSGVALLMAYATQLLTNPVFVAKLIFIALAVANVMLINRKVFGEGAAGNPLPKNAKLLAASSLFFWIGAILLGRFTAYIGLVAALFGGGEG